MEYKSCSDKYIWSADDSYFYKGLSELIVDIDEINLSLTGENQKKILCLSISIRLH
ncbi:regulator of CFA/I fimbriae [Klebsiella pneumoniae]|uniref:Regulator of CFA/I fimbriae n=1 Tax=Klebsiella pneumoniae TaxID=573 RepID=A0A2X3GNH4_KLEPN|nr:regulator of CFA/I fimbriae [Klebsiella pneumoniae]